jgi:hypothetical protein
MAPIEVLAVEIRQFAAAGVGGPRTLAPRAPDTFADETR